MMVVNEVAALAHAMEDIFFYLREKKPKQVDCSSLVDILLQAEDFIHSEMEKLSEGEAADGIAQDLIKLTRQALAFLKDSNGEKSSHDAAHGQQRHVADQEGEQKGIKRIGEFRQIELAGRHIVEQRIR